MLKQGPNMSSEAFLLLWRCEFSSKTPIFHLWSNTNSLISGWGQLCTSEIIHLYQNLIFLFNDHNQILVMKCNDRQKPLWYKRSELTVLCTIHRALVWREYRGRKALSFQTVVPTFWLKKIPGYIYILTLSLGSFLRMIERRPVSSKVRLN